MNTDTLNADAVEAAVSRVEDVVIMMLHKDRCGVQTRLIAQRTRTMHAALLAARLGLGVLKSCMCVCILHCTHAR